MSDEFKKLDQFMEMNRPVLKNFSDHREIHFSQKENWWGVVVALGIGAIMTFTVIRRHDEKMQNVVALSEMMSLDFTTDELPEEFEHQLAAVE